MIVNIGLLVLISLALTLALEESIPNKNVVFDRVIWGVMLPSYIVVIITGLMNLIVPTLPIPLQFLETVGWIVFLYTGIIYGIILFFVKKEQKTKQEVNIIETGVYPIEQTREPLRGTR